MHSEPSSALLDRVRKLLAKAEAEGVTPPEAEALTAKAAELMARYGIDRARLAATHPDTDRPSSRIIDISNPWAQVRAHLLAGLAGAMRCQCVLLSTTRPGARIHVFLPDLMRQPCGAAVRGEAAGQRQAITDLQRPIRHLCASHTSLPSIIGRVFACVYKLGIDKSAADCKLRVYRRRRSRRDIITA